jgi:g-D-glutamyl-meso-diaminopimelate peptidase
MRIRVRQGDTLWYYSQLFKVPFRLVVEANRDIDENQLAVGQFIQLPGYIINNYVIKRGDTFYSISRERGTPLDALFLLNQSVNPKQLRIGQNIQVPSRLITPIVDPRQEYDYETMMNDLQQLVSIYPFLRQNSIGNSVLNRSIPEIQIGRGGKSVHVNGSFHANEWITTNVLMNFLNDYVLALTNQTTIRGLVMSPLYDGTTLSMVPMVDPDGVNLVLNGPPGEEPYNQLVVDLNNGSTDFSNWKANIRGVDLNNQFPARWEIEQRRKPQNPAPRDYPGPYPLSEPEAIAMADLTRRSNFDRVLAFHTQGEVIFWGFLGLEPPESETIVNEFGRVSGYEPIRYVDSYAGYKDWFIQEWQRPGYTVELGEGVNPLPLSQYDEIYQESLGILLVSLYI